MKTLGRILLAAVAYVVGSIITGVVAPLLHVSELRLPAGLDPSRMFVAFVASTPLLAIGVLPLAARLGGSWVKRFLALSALLYITIGLNTMIEAKIFTTLVEGGAFTASLFSLLPCLLASAVLATGAQSPALETSLAPRNAGGWMWRVAAAWLAFPVIYWAFGMCVGPFVIPYYNGSALGLRIPAASVIVMTQLLRSALFLLASLPAILLWKGSRRQFFWAMGMAHAFAVGIFQLSSAIFMPPTLRILHSVEITADSFAYAAILAWLFIAKEPAHAEVVPVVKEEVEELSHTAAG